MATTISVAQEPNPSPQPYISSVGRNPYFEGMVFDRALIALGGKTTPKPHHIREARRQILRQMAETRGRA